MPALREHIRTEVDVFREDRGGDVVPRDVFQLLEGYDELDAGIGVFGEGQEIQPPLEDGEAPTNCSLKVSPAYTRISVEM